MTEFYENLKEEYAQVGYDCTVETAHFLWIESDDDDEDDADEE